MTAWRYSLASVPGTSHLQRGVPCQDHSEVATIPAIGEPKALIIVAADGAGSASRSDEGARAACKAFLEFSLLALNWVCGAEYLGGDFAVKLLTDLQEDIATIAQDANERVREFACTLLGGLITPNAALFVQLGDGAIVYRVGSDDVWRIAAKGHRGEFANETIFVTGHDAATQVQAVLVERPVDEVAIMTDGVEFLAIKQPGIEPHGPFFEYTMAGLRATGGSGEMRDHNQWVREFLDSEAVSQRTDDDKTLILATRLGCPTGF
jgi:hypothetical protein